jgi:hypothetical protein
VQSQLGQVAVSILSRLWWVWLKKIDAKVMKMTQGSLVYSPASLAAKSNQIPAIYA